MKMIIDSKKAKTKLPQVMRAAIHLFMKKGIDGTTIKEIAREAGVAEGALYRHFKSKDDLAWHIFSAHLKQFTDDLSAKVFIEESAEARIRTFVEESFTAYEKERDLFTFLILREHGELKKYSTQYAHPGDVAIRIIQEGQKIGEIRAGEPYILASLFVGGVIRTCVVKMYGDLHKNITTYAPEVAGMIWAMLKSPNRA